MNATSEANQERAERPNPAVAHPNATMNTMTPAAKAALKTTAERTLAKAREDAAYVGVRHDECELADGQPGDCFLVIALGYWGRGPTVFEAATKCRESGAKLDQKVVVRLVVGDATACVDSQGYVVRDPASRNIDIGTVKRLSTLLGNFR